MRKTFFALLAAFTGSAIAAPATSWIEVSHGELERDWPTAPYDEGEGTETALAAAYASSGTGYWRLDARQQSHDFDVQPLAVGDQPVPGAFITADTEIDSEAWSRTFERTIQTLTGGIRSPLNSGVDLIGEIGVMRASIELDDLVLVSGATPAVIGQVFTTRSEHEASGAVGRLGIVVEDGSVAWGATMEWFNKMPTGVLDETDSVQWWNAHLGYRITPNWTISLRYADNEEFTSKGLSLRWTL